jgi:hypothetical protein
VTRTVSDGTERARLGGDLTVHRRVLVEDADGVWRDLTNFHGVDWVVRIEFGVTIDDRAMTATVLVIRDGDDTDVGHMSIAPQIVASPANHKADTTYAPLINPHRRIRILTDTEHFGAAPLTLSTWKRVFEGRIDAVDPAASPEGHMSIRCRDRAAYLLNTWIETKRTYGSDEGAGTPIESVIQDIIDDNPVPYGATLVVPVSPDFNVGAFDQDNQNSVMDAIYNLALLQGADIRYMFRNDGDTDSELLYLSPERDKTTPDWTFGPDEYLEIPRAPLDDADVRNAITVDYFDSSVGRRQQVTRTNAASINAFGRRWGQTVIKDKSQLDSATEANDLGDAMVSDLGAPPFEHEMRTFYFWPLSIGDLVRFQLNNKLYDQNQDLAVVGFTHVLENGEGYTTMQCRGTPAGAYRAWLGKLGPGGGGGFIVHGTYEIVAIDATSVTLAVSGSFEGSSALPVVAWAWSTLNPVASRISGADQMVFVPSGSQWKFARPNPGAGDATVGFLVGNDVVSSILLQIPIPEGTAFPSPTIDDPFVSVIDDPTDDFDVDWTVHTMPSGATYKLFWRFSAGGPWNFHSGLTTEADTITHAEHGQVITGLGTQNAEIQVYVEAFDSFGAHIAQSAVVTKTYHFEGFG